MPGTPPLRTGAAAAALAQTAAAVGAHVLAVGCLPGGRGLAVAVPLSVAGVLLLGRLLDRRPLLLLAGGQLTGHAALATAAACTGHAHGDQPQVAMTLSHVGALVLCRAVLDRVVAAVESAVSRLLRRTALLLAQPRVPVPPRPPLPVPAPLRGRATWGAAGLRGPPTRLLPAA